MEHAGPSTALLAGVAVLERAIAYALGSLAVVEPAMLARPTPCACWDLRDLLTHLGDSMAALQEAAETGRVGLVPAAVPEVIPWVRDRAAGLLGAWANARDSADVLIAEAALSAPLVAGAGAIEVAVHGWDVAEAAGHPRPIPADLADELLDLAIVMVRPADRPGRFGRPLRPPAGAPPADRLLAFLGRSP